MFNGIQNNSFGFNKSIVATDLSGNSVEVASCYTSLVTGDTRKSISVSIEITKPDIVDKHLEAVQNQVDSFFKTVNDMARSQGLLVIQPAEAKVNDMGTSVPIKEQGGS